MCEVSCSPGRQPQIQPDGKTLVCGKLTSLYIDNRFGLLTLLLLSDNYL